jgi:hypothetical protein
MMRNVHQLSMLKMKARASTAALLLLNLRSQEEVLC